MPGKSYNSNNDSDIVRKNVKKVAVIFKRVEANNCEINTNLFSNVILYKNYARSTSPVHATK